MIRIYPFAKHDADRFWAKVDRRGADECWPWTGAHLPHGYGLLRAPHARRNLHAHRVAWVLKHGREVPAGLCVLHRCDNPPCCNPAHLFLGTQVDNIRDRVAKGRSYRGLGEQNGSAKLTEADVREIRARYGYYGKAGQSQPALAIKYGVRQSAISAVIRRKTWAHIG